MAAGNRQVAASSGCRVPTGQRLLLWASDDVKDPVDGVAGPHAAGDMAGEFAMGENFVVVQVTAGDDLVQPIGCEEVGNVGVFALGHVGDVVVVHDDEVTTGFDTAEEFGEGFFGVPQRGVERCDQFVLVKVRGFERFSADGDAAPQVLGGEGTGDAAAGDFGGFEGGHGIAVGGEIDGVGAFARTDVEGGGVFRGGDERDFGDEGLVGVAAPVGSIVVVVHVVGLTSHGVPL